VTRAGKYLDEHADDSVQLWLEHYLDAWHVEKNGLFKKLLPLAQKSKPLAYWVPRLRAHLYWCLRSSFVLCDGDIVGAALEARERWVTCLDHVRGEHRQCSHRRSAVDGEDAAPLSDEAAADEHRLDKLDPEAFTKLRAIVESFTVKRFRRIVPCKGTTPNESFNSVLAHYAPKKLNFNEIGHELRTGLAVLHYNSIAGKYVCTLYFLCI